MPICFLIKDRMGIYPGERIGGKDLGRVEREETIVRIYDKQKKKSIFNKIKNNNGTHYVSTVSFKKSREVFQ